VSFKARVRQHLERIDGVSRTWFEWDLEKMPDGGELELVKTLVVEVEFDTDPNNPQWRQNVLHAIRDTAMGMLKDETTMNVSHLKIVPKSNAG
jgi:hypothetical protein